MNDLAVSGAIPRFLSAGFILEEGLSLKDLEKIVAAMAVEAANAKVQIVTGDTNRITSYNVCYTKLLRPEFFTMAITCSGVMAMIFLMASPTL